MNAVNSPLKALNLEKVKVAVNFGIITLIGVVVFRNFLFSSYWPSGGDILGWISRAYLFAHDLRWTYTWRPQSFGFSENLYAMDFFYMLFYSLLKDPVLLIKLVMFFVYVFSGFSVYILAFSYTRNNLASLSASLVYMTNQWVASQLTEAHLAILISYACFPLFLFLFDQALKKGKLKTILAFSLSLAFLWTGFHPECVIIYSITLILFAITYLSYPSKEEKFQFRVKRMMKVIIISAATSFLLSAFFTIPFILNVNAPYLSTKYSYFIEDFYNISYKNLTDAFVLRAIENWGYTNVIGDVYYGLTLQNFPTYMLLCFIFGLAVLITLIFRLNRYTVFFTTVMLVSILLAMGPYSILGDFFIWAWSNIPHFSAFRAASRWIMMAALSHSYFISVLVSMITGYLSKSKASTTGEYNFTVKIHKINVNNPFKCFRISIEQINFILRKMNKFLRILGFFLLLAIFVSGFISCEFLFSQGLQVHTLPECYVKPYYWIANQTGDFKIVTVNNSPEEWLGSSAETDFAFPGMLTEVGWWHDIGQDSAYIHDKPVLQNGGWDFSSREFVDHLRFRVARQQLTENMFKILGTFNYKYVVIPCYASEKIREFFFHQKGVEITYNSVNSFILKNRFYTSQIFASENYSVIVGGLESFLSLTKIEGFNLSKNALIFADKNQELLENGILKNSEFLIFVNSRLIDLIMLTMKDSLIRASDYGFKSLDYENHWVKWPSWRTVGSFVYWDDVLTTSGANAIKIPFQVDGDGCYYIWIRLGFAPNRGELTITVDNLFQTKIKPETKFWSEPRWINLTCLGLERGNHVITIKNDGTGFNDIDSIAVIKTSTFHEQERKILENIKNSDTSLLYLLEAEINFLKNPDSTWNFESYPYNDYLISHQTTENGQILTENMKIYTPKEGNYQFFARCLKGPQNGILHLKVDNIFLNASCYSENPDFEWLNLGSVYMTQGEHEIGVRSTGTVKLDLLAIASTRRNERFSSIDELFKEYLENTIISFEKVSPCLYKVHVKAEKPFILVFSDAYHPLWKAFLDDGTEISPINLYHIVNGFFINKTGEFNLTVYFVGQDYVNLGLDISLSAFIIITITLVMPQKAYRKIRRKFLSLKTHYP